MNSLDENGNLTGFGRELADAVIKAAGAEVKHIHTPYWVEVLEWLDSGKADFIHDTGYTKERDEFLDYSRPIIEMPEMIFVRHDQYDITGLHSLKGKKVACVNKHISHLYLQTFSKITCYVVKTPAEGLYELISGKVDAFVYPEQIVLYLAQNLRLIDKIKMTGDPLRTLTWSMVVKEGNQEILTLLNEGIEKVRGTEEYDRIYNKWWGRKALAGYSERELHIITLTAVGLSVILVSLIALILYNYKLSVGKKRLEKEIFERKHAEEALRESERKYHSLFSSVNEGVCLHNIIYDQKGQAVDYRILEVNPAYEMILGIKPEEAIGRKATQLYGTDEPPYMDIFLKVVETGEPVSFETFFPPMDMHLRVSAFSPDKGQIATLFADITERKRVEEELLIMKTLSDQTNEIIAIKDKNFKYMIANPVCVDELSKISGHEQIVGSSDYQILPKEMADILREIDERVVIKNEVVVTEELVGEKIYLSRKFPIKDYENNTIAMGLIATDITERKQTEEQIKSSLKEKEILLKEIHHRVKNNMQVIISLLKLQSENIMDKQYFDMFKESQDRIRSMALVHEKLYQTRNLADVDFKGYVKSLVTSLFRSYISESRKIALKIEAGDISLGLESAIPCGLIINELVSNALKYAFPEEREGEIRVIFNSINGDDLVLEVSDNGIGLPEELDIRNTESMGLHLVTILSEDQLHGQIELNRIGGAKFYIKFRQRTYKARI